jgi:hypothetical protein
MSAAVAGVGCAGRCGSPLAGAAGAVALLAAGGGGGGGALPGAARAVAAGWVTAGPCPARVSAQAMQAASRAVSRIARFTSDRAYALSYDALGSRPVNPVLG